MRTVVLLRSFAFGTASGLRTMTGLAGVFRTGAVAAAYAGLSARRWLAARITPVAAGILEDGVAIGIACLAARGRRGAT
jgi:uncharacterized membrane protein